MIAALRTPKPSGSLRGPVLVAMLMLASPAFGQSAGAPGGRYQLQESGPNVLRLDRETGEIASCSPGEGARWSCETLVAAAAPSEPEGSSDLADADASSEPESRSDLVAENRRLTARVAELEDRLAQVAAVAASADVPTTDARPAQTSGFDVEQTRREIDQAVEVTDYAVRRFRDLVEALTADDANR